MRVAYLGSFPFPGSTAATQRVQGIAEALTIRGHQVCIVPMIKGDGRSRAAFSIDTSQARQPVAGTPRSALEILVGSGRAIRWLERNASQFDVAILYGTPAAALLRYLWAGRRNSTTLPPLILDVVEWYEYSHRPGGRFGPYSAEHALAMNYLAPRTGNAICISRFLATHFATHGVNTLVVPPLWGPIGVVRQATLEPGMIHVGYAGSPGAKDGPGLRNLLAAVERLPNELRSRLRIQIVGLDQSAGEQLLRIGRSTPARAWARGVIRWHGRIAAIDAQAIVAACDFTYLQRPPKRYATAGFPTKVVESLALGTPVITNLTSDLECYVFDGENGVILDAPDQRGDGPEAVSRALEIILKPGFRLGLNRGQIADLAASQFHPRRYADHLDDFLRAVAEAS